MLLSVFTIVSVSFSIWRLYAKRQVEDAFDLSVLSICCMSLLMHGLGAMWAIHESIETIAYLRVMKEYPNYSCGGAYRCSNIQSVAEAKYQLEQHRMGFYGFIVRALE